MITDIVVRDRHGRIVHSLAANELQVTDNGTRTKISSLRRFEPGKDTTDPALVFLVLEDTSEEALSTAHLAVSEYQKHRRGANLAFSIWTAHDRVRLVQDFTSDTTVLDAALRTAGRRKTSKPNPLVFAQGASDVRKELAERIARTSSDLIKNQHVRPFVAALFAIARESSSIKGRKTAIYFSDEASLGSLDNDQLRVISGEANSSQVSFYAVNTATVGEKALNDASRLLMDSLGMGKSVTEVANTAYRLGITNNKEAVGLKGETRQMPQSKRLAEDTGGSYIFNSGPLRKAFRSAFEDAVSYYELSYVPASENGQYHSTSVTVARADRVNARAGYFPAAHSDELTEAPYEIPLAEALNSPDRSESIWFNVDAKRAAASDSVVPLKLLIRVPLNGLMAYESDSTRRFQLRLAYLALIKTRDGKPVRKFSQDVLLEGSLERLGSARGNFYTFTPSFSLRPGDYLVDVAISDGNAHRVSAKTLHFTAAKDMPLDEEASGTDAFSAFDELDISNSGLQESESEQDGSWHPVPIPNAARPSESEIRGLLAGARQRANDYKRMLPNFVCLMTTRRFMNSNPRGLWKLKDVYSTLLGYVDGREKTILLEINGARAGPGEVVPDGASVTGEFGELLGMPFSEMTEASSNWLGAADIAGVRTQVFQFDVKRKHSEFQVITRQRESILAAYRAVLYIDSNTSAVRRVSVEAQDLPAEFPIQASTVTVDYDYFSISGRDYLLPSHAILSVRERARPARRNEIRFQNYRRYGAESSLSVDR